MNLIKENELPLLYCNESGSYYKPYNPSEWELLNKTIEQQCLTLLKQKLGEESKYD